MSGKTKIVLVVAGLALAACSTSPLVTRKANQDVNLLTADEPAHETVLAAPSFHISEVRVIVPSSLKVSEANTIKPRADIVWRGDPIGDRYAQVKAIMENALTRATEGLEGDRDVVLEAQVLRFHGVTERTRYTFGGVHEIVFEMVLRDAETGELVAPPRTVMADLEALAGQEAIDADARGETQKVRVTNHIIEVMQGLFAQPMEIYAG